MSSTVEETSSYGMKSSGGEDDSGQKQIPLDVSQLSGRWEGKSLSKRNDPTYWKESVLKFNVISEEEAEVVGGGISYWRFKRIPFTVVGKLNLFTREMVIKKKHTGEYTNTVEYKTVVLPEKGVISGEYAGGVIVLKHVRGRALDHPELLLSGLWAGESNSHRNEPTTWSDTILHFEHGKDGKNAGTVSGEGTSLWKNLQIEFKIEGTYDWDTKEISLRKQHLGRYTNTVEYKCIILPDSGIIEGNYENGTIYIERLQALDLPSIEEIRVMSMTDAQLQEIKKREEEGRRRAGEARKIEELLSGIWEGESIDSDDNVTLWTETGLQFKLNPVTMEGSIEGDGVSEWRAMSIDFSVKGEFNWNTREIKLHKQHKGRYTNRIQYNGWLRERKGTAGEGDGGSSKSMSPTSALISSLVNNNIDDVISSQKKWKIEGKYAKGVISLTKRRDFSHKGGFSLENINRNSYSSKKDADEQVDQTRPGSKQDEAGSDLTQGNGDVNGVATKQTDLSDIRLAKYEMFLAGMLSSGRKLNAKDQYNLSTFRKQNGINDDEHWDVVASIGYSRGDFNALLGDDKGNNAGDGDDTCKICFTEPINAVILPCGHFAICIDCGRNLLRRNPTGAKCPICRNSLTNITQVYKA